MDPRTVYPWEDMEVGESFMCVDPHAQSKGAGVASDLIGTPRDDSKSSSAPPKYDSSPQAFVSMMG